MTQNPQAPLLNSHNKQEYPPAHTAEHLLNGLMDQTYHCGRAFSAHVERQKSKLDYHLDTPLSPQQIQALEDRINQIIAEDVEVWVEYAKQADVAQRFDMTRGSLR